MLLSGIPDIPPPQFQCLGGLGNTAYNGLRRAQPDVLLTRLTAYEGRNGVKETFTSLAPQFDLLWG